MASEGHGTAREPMLQGQRPEEANPEAGAAVEEDSPSVLAPPVRFVALFRYLRPGDRWLLLLGFLGAVAQGATQPALAFFMRDLFQAIFLPNDNDTLPPAAGPHDIRDQHVRKSFFIFLALGAISFVTSGMSYLGLARVADNMTLELRRRFFDHLMRKDIGWYDSRSSSSMATRLTNDTYDFRQGVGEKLGQFIMGITMSPLGFVVAFTQDWRLTLMMLVGIPIMAVGFAVAMKTMTKNVQQQQEFYSQAGGTAETAISSIRTVAAFGGYEHEIAKYREKLVAAEANGVRAGWCNGFSMGFSQSSIWCIFALGFYAGSILVIHDVEQQCWVSDPPFGDCFTGATMLSTLFAVLYGGIGLGQVAPSMVTLTAAKAAAARIYQVIDEPPAFELDCGESLAHVEGSVEFKDVVFSYPTRPDCTALDRASLVVASGKTAAFVGPSGSGKSTIIALLQRFYDPQAGSVCLDGHDIRGLNLTWLRSKMALVQQEPVLFSGTIQENIAYGKQGASAQDVETAAKAANAHDFVSNFPSKYQTEVGERGVQLSGGQKQRIAIARAMVRNPVVLLLDEATSALDTESERIVQKALDELLAQKARTTLVIAHRLSTIRDADQIFVLEDGKLLERGNHSELMLAGGLYAQLVELQEVTGADDQEELFQRQRSGGSFGDTAAHSQVSTPTRTLSRQLKSPNARGRAISGRALSFSGPDSIQNTQEQESASGGAAAAQGATPEDDVDLPVPTSRLWAMQRQDLGFVVLALLCTVPVGAGRPCMGYLFADSSNLFSQQPAMMDVKDLRAKADKQCLEFAILGIMTGMATCMQMGGFRRAAESMTRQVRLMTFKAMLRQEIAWFDARTTGHLADRLASEAPLIKSFTGESLASVLQLLCTIGTGLVMALWASWELTLCSVVFLPFLMAGTMAVMKSMQTTNQTAAGPLVSEAMGNIRTVAAFGLRDTMLQRYMALLGTEGALARKQSNATAFAGAYNSGITFLMFGGIIFIANIFISHGWIDPRDVLQVLFPLLFASSGAALASQWQADKAKAQAAVNHVFRTLDRTPAIDAYDESGDKLASVTGEIEFSHVAFRYPSRPDVPVFADFDLKIQPSTTVAFCGPSGSGKSTIISLLQRFYNPDSGSVLLDGHDIRSLNLAWLRRQMALVQQEPVLFAGSIGENIAYGREGATQQECQEAAKAANADGFISALPEGYTTEVGERGAQLSGGQKQRIAIARSMVREPAVLLLDEATSALDTESERVVQEALDELLRQSRRTTLVIAHRLSTIVNSDMICVIYEGRIVEKGKHAELLRIPGGQYKKLAERQGGA